MELRPVTPPADLAPDLAVREVRATIIDVPTVRRHKLSQLSVTAQSTVIVELMLANGVTGVGEAATLGGPRWSEECVECIKAVIDAHLAPAVLGEDGARFETMAARMNAAAKRNNAAKGAIESALFDAVGKTLGVPAVQLLGGIVRDRMPVYWTLASGDPAQEIEEAEVKLAHRLHDRFKIKIGAQPVADDLARLKRLAAALGDRATLIVDANQAWDEAIAIRAMPVLAELGISLVEQPLPAWNVEGMARVRQRSAVPILADECVFDAHDALRVAATSAADALSLKIVKHGGLLGVRRVAAVAEAGGLSLYGGCLLESSIGAAAHLHAFAGLRTLAWGCEHFGPHILTEDLAVEPIRIADFNIHLPTGPGLGVTLDPDKLRRFARP
jgi:muconate cycloisomerase